MSTNKNFGIVFFVVFLVIALFPLINEGSLIIWSLIISFIFLILALLNSKLLYPLNKIWFNFGTYLGKIFSPIIMIIIFFVVVTPIGLIMRILKKDILNLNFNNKKSYWIKRNNQKGKMKNQF